jgi:3-hydroxy acid dehydrogenase / malonic semialdehyde reductase
MNRTIMVTGATSGFGKAIAEKFAKNGFNLIITGRRDDRLKELEAELKSNKGIKILSLAFDVRNNKEVIKAISSIPEEWQKIDILVNNAGLAVGMEHVDEGVIDDWERMIDTNLKGLLYVSRAVLPLMTKRNSGHVINIGSIAGRDAYEYGNVYCASKAAVDSLSKGMRADLLKKNIKVTHVAPGMAETEFSIVRFKGDDSKAKNVYKGIEPLKAEDVAEVVFYCANLPAHVCINDLTITCTQQASAFYSYRRES